LPQVEKREQDAWLIGQGFSSPEACRKDRVAVEAVADGDTTLAAGVLDQAQPESPDGEAATVAGRIGLARPRPAGPVAARARHAGTPLIELARAVVR
jgi:hypothetical protein